MGRQDQKTTGKRLKEGFEYTSDKNTEWLTIKDLKRMTGEQ